VSTFNVDFLGQLGISTLPLGLPPDPVPLLLRPHTVEVERGKLLKLWWVQAMGRGTRRQQVAREQRTAAFTAGLTAERRTLAVRASRRGPVPDDPAIRAAAVGVTEDRLEQSISQRSKNLAIFAVIGLLEV